LSHLQDHFSLLITRAHVVNLLVPKEMYYYILRVSANHIIAHFIVFRWGYDVEPAIEALERALHPLKEFDPGATGNVFPFSPHLTSINIRC